MKKVILFITLLFISLLFNINVKANNIYNINAVYNQYTNKADVSWQDNNAVLNYNVYVNNRLYTSTSSNKLELFLEKNNFYNIKITEQKEEEEQLADTNLYTGTIEKQEHKFKALNSVQIKFNKVYGNGYYIYRAKNNKNYKVIKKITNNNITEFNDQNLEYGKTYYYKVIPYIIYNKKEYLGYSKTELNVTIFLKTKVTNLYVKQDNYNVNKLTWNKKIGATGYKIYMSNKRHGKYKKIGVTLKNEYYHKNVSYGKVYYYKVKAYKAIGNSDILGNESDIYSRFIRPLTPSVNVTVVGNDSLKVSYTKLRNITNYQIYRANCDGCEFKRIKTTKENVYTDKKLKKNKIYYYKIRAIKHINEENIYGRFSGIKYETTTERNAKNKLKLTSVYGDTEAYHPSILYFKDGWNGYKYWLGFTPYPNVKNVNINGDSSKENPHIKVSNDLKNWIIPKGTPNPLDIPEINTKNIYNSDIDLVYNEKKDRIECFWRRYENDEIIIYMRYTTDGHKWSDKKEVFRIETKYNILLSPSILYDEGEYKMWYVSGYKIRYMEFDSIPFEEAKIEKTFNIETRGEKIYPWHLDVIKNNDKYEIVYVGTNTIGSIRRMSLYYTSSKDNSKWDTAIKVLGPSREKYAWDGRGIYRSSFMYNNGKYYLFYSASNRWNEKGTGVLSGNSMTNLYPVFN